MRQQQFIRFVEEICFLLKLSQPCSKTALQYFMQFKEYENHGYDQEILVAACIYLAVKIFEEQVRIRDILNMVYVLTSLYRMSAQQGYNDKEMEQEKKQQMKEIKQKQSMIDERVHIQAEENEQKETQIKQQMKRVVDEKIKQQLQIPVKNIPSSSNQPQLEQPKQQQEQPYILLKNIQNFPNLHQLIQPKYSLSDYNQYKSKIIQAQQMLLRILGFSFRLSEENKKELKKLLIMIHHMRIPPTMAETIIKVYNDVHYIDIEYWPEGVVYFGYLVTKVFVGERQRKKGQEIGGGKELDDMKVIVLEKEKSFQDLQLKEFKSTGSQKKPNDKETTQINRINHFVKLMTKQKWQSLLATDIKLLQNYAQKLTNFYSSIKTNQ